jgi:hypothetical protein
MTLEINELSVHISVVAAGHQLDQPDRLRPPSRSSAWLAEIKEEIIRQSVSEILSRLRRMEAR